MYLKLLLTILNLAISCNGQTDLEEFVKQNRIFTQNIFKEILAVEFGNFMFSPLSIQIILSLLTEGAVGDTALQLINGLNIPNDETERHAVIQAIINDLTPESEEYDLVTANKIYAAESLTAKEAFMNIASEVYDIEYENLNFSDSEAAADTMNEWVEDQTNERIQDLIPSNLLSNDTMAVLINTLYMKANWTNVFDKTKTKNLPFYKLEDDSVDVDIMHQEMITEYYDSEEFGAQYLKLNYNTSDENDLSMTIILPIEPNLGNLEDNLDKVFSTNIPLSEEKVAVSLPKFKFETYIELNPMLKNLGIENVFDENLADFSNIGSKLFVSAVLQKTFIDLSESGTGAAAATADIMSMTSNYPLPQLFNANHPFLFYISLNGYILFAGKIMEPVY